MSNDSLSSDSLILQSADQTLRSGLCIPTSTLFLDGEINGAMAGMVARSLHILDLVSSPITIYLSTYGGDVDSALGIYDLIRACKNKTQILGYGPVMSAGVTVLQAANERLLTPSACVMVHPGYGNTAVDMPENVTRQADAIKAGTARCYAILARRCGMNVKEFHQKFLWDSYLSAKQSVKLGLADGISR